MTLEISTETSLDVTSQGLKISKPIMTLTGDGIVEISVNGFAQFQVNIDDSYITVDSMLEECYKDNIKTLKNHQMTGEFPTLQPGENTITWTENLTKIEIKSMSRWAIKKTIKFFKS